MSNNQNLNFMSLSPPESNLLTSLNITLYTQVQSNPSGELMSESESNDLQHVIEQLQLAFYKFIRSEHSSHKFSKVLAAFLGQPRPVSLRNDNQ